MDRLRGYEVFVTVIERGGFAHAARVLGMSNAMVSTHIARLEERMGCRLLNRSAHRLQLTTEGHRFVAQARRILEYVEDAEGGRLTGRQSVGRVRVDVPTWIGSIYFAPYLKRFRLNYPGVVLELSFGDRGTLQRLDEFDIVVRIGEMGDASALKVPLTVTRFVQVASPSYLADRALPAEPEASNDHDCILFASAGLPGGNPWRFEHDGSIRWLRLPSVMTANHGDVLRRAAVDGVGVVQTLEMLIARELADGDLVRILDDWNRAPVPVGMYVRPDRADAPAVSATVDFFRHAVDWSRAGAQPDSRMGN